MSFFRPLMAVAALALATPAFAQAPATVTPAASPAVSAPASTGMTKSDGTTAPAAAGAEKTKVASKTTKHHSAKAVKTVSAKTTAPTVAKSDSTAK